MDFEKLSDDRKEVVKKMELYEREGRFDEDVENDPPSSVLLPNQIDYLRKSPIKKIKAKIANFLGNKFFKGLEKKGYIIFDGVEGEENLSALKDGAVIMSNHFGIVDNYIVYKASKKYLKKKRLYRIIREGNYTGMKGLYGFLFRNADTLPLSSNKRTMMNMLSATNTILRRGNTVLIYPEQGMWWNYRKPRPFKIGGFKIAYKAEKPVVPVFITMTDHESIVEPNGAPLQRYVLHAMPPVYPDLTLGEKLGAKKMLDETYALFKAKYEEVYGEELSFAVGE